VSSDTGREGVLIQHLRDPRDPVYAEAIVTGTWIRGGLCPECGAGTSKLVSPTVIEWQPGSDVLGDFTWAAFGSTAIVTERVRRQLEETFRCTFRNVKMQQSPRLKRPSRLTSRTKPRVWLPYTGPPLYELVTVGTARLDRAHSNWVLKDVCSTCGNESWRIPTVGRITIIDKRTWTGDDLFRLAEAPGWILTTRAFRNFVESHGFTNVSFLEEGWIR